MKITSTQRKMLKMSNNEIILNSFIGRVTSDKKRMITSFMVSALSQNGFLGRINTSNLEKWMAIDEELKMPKLATIFWEGVLEVFICLK